MIDVRGKSFQDQLKMFEELNRFIHSGELESYHMKHIFLMEKYAIHLANKLDCQVYREIPEYYQYITLTHDLFKEKSLKKNKRFVEWNGVQVPHDLNWYVRSNLDILELYDLDDYFNTSIQYHSLAAGIFLYKEFNIQSPDILYPVWFHSCPIIPVYLKLNSTIQRMVDIVVLADKLSSNYLRINFLESKVRVDLDQIVFGNDGHELNFTLGLFIARLINMGNSKEEQSRLATEYYHDRLMKINPLIPKKYSISKLGGARLWEKRNSQVLQMP